MEKISVAKARSEEATGRSVILQGWVRTRRDSKAGFSFLEINDGSCLANIQVICDAELANYESEIQQLTAGCSVTVAGDVKPSGGRGQETEIQAAEVTVHGWADPASYPLQKKRHSFEKLREWAHLRPRSNTFGAVARVRNQICRSIHDYFQQQDFLYVHTPIITASDCEGAGEMFKVTTLDLDALAARQTAVDYQFDFFDRPAYLTVSGQLEAETFATALGKVYTFGPTFRAENSNTSRHLAEFWMVEPEVAFAQLPENMDLAEGLIKRIFGDVLNLCDEDMQFFNDRIDQTVIETLQAIVEGPFERITYTEAIALLDRASTKFEYQPQWGHDLQSEHERYLTETAIGRPAIVCDYPCDIKPFYMRVNEDEKTVRAMDVLVPKVGEIVGGSQREDRLDVLEARMRGQQLDPDTYWWYLDLRRYGTVPHAGFGLGLERIVQFTTGMSNIRDVIPFPRTPGNAEF